MKRYIMLSLDLIFVASLFLFSCKKQSVNQDQEEGQVEISFSISNLKSATISNSDTVSASTLAYVIVSVEDINGTVIKNSEKIDLYNMNGSYISKPLSLTKGNYKLTRFLVLDWQNNVVYSSPLKGSAKAYLVTNPLPLTFTIQTNSVTKLSPEVLNAAGCKPEDFGYATFSFNVAQTFDFLVGTFVYNDTVKNFKLTSSNISIYQGSATVYNGTTSAPSILLTVYDNLGVTNTVTLPEKYNTYTLVVSKPGYKTFTQSYTKEELKLHFRSVDKGPLVIILEKGLTVNDGLVAYYKFNGDVKDYSGFGNDGTYYGRTAYSSGYKADNNGAIDLNGSSDYVLIKNSESLSPTSQITICAWYYSASFYGNGANSLVCKENTISPAASLYHLAVQGDQYYGNPVFGFNVTTTLGANPIYTSGVLNYQMNKWYFVVGEYDGAYSKLYVNGTLIASKPQTGQLLNSSNNIYIGSTEGLLRPSYDFLKGKVDEVRIYNRALSDAEILSLYQQ